MSEGVQMLGKHTLPIKYRVFKVAEKGEGAFVGEELDSDEFFVIKRGDVFAKDAIMSYASMLGTVVDLDSTFDFLSKEQYEHLQRVADGLFDLASNWADHPTAIPD